MPASGSARRGRGIAQLVKELHRYGVVEFGAIRFTMLAVIGECRVANPDQASHGGVVELAHIGQGAGVEHLPGTGSLDVR